MAEFFEFFQIIAGLAPKENKVFHGVNLPAKIFARQKLRQVNGRRD